MPGEQQSDSGLRIGQRQRTYFLKGSGFSPRRGYRNPIGPRQMLQWYTLGLRLLFSALFQRMPHRSPEVVPAYDSRARRALFTVVLFFAVCAVVGSVLQRKWSRVLGDESQLRDSLKSFTNVYALVEQNYAEPINGDKADTAIYDGAIPGMLRVLDPHSTFYDPKAYARMREEQRGHYYGVGMTIQPQNGKVYVVFPAEGAPAFKAGIHPATSSTRWTASWSPSMARIPTA